MRGTSPWLLAIVAACLARSTPADAWSPGHALRSWVGGFVESATRPSIHNLEQSGKELLDQANNVIGDQLDRAHDVTSDLIAQTDKVVAADLDKVDHSLEARIVQVHAVGDQVVDRAFGRLDRAIGSIDDIARKRIEQVGKLAKDVLNDANAKAVALIANADGILGNRIEDVHQVVDKAIHQADQVIAARIEQIDEVTGRRIGNIDVIATKQSLGLEWMLLRLASLIGLLGFVAFVLWRLVVEAGHGWRTASDRPSLMRRIGATLRHLAPRFIVQAALAASGVALFLLLSYALPRDAKTRVDRQLQQHKDAMLAAMTAYDFTRVRYETSQLAILDPTSASAYDTAERKAALLRDVLGRPALLETSAGVRQVAAQASFVEHALGKPDADLLALECFIQWQVGSTRRDEYEAAKLCAASLAVVPAGTQSLLAPLARNYLRVFFHDPYPAGPETPPQDLLTLQRAVPNAPDKTESPQFQHVIEFDTLVQQLDTSSTEAYLDMLDAQVRFQRARATNKSADTSDASRAAIADRSSSAASVVAAWRMFDNSLSTSWWLVDDPTSLAAFTLNDVVLSHALYFAQFPDKPDLLPELVEPRTPTKDKPASPKVSSAERIAIAPIRVAWERRYAKLIGPRAKDILAFEEARRYIDFERKTVDFEHAYVAFELALAEPQQVPLDKLALDAIRTASELELYRDEGTARRPLAAILIDAYRATHGPDLDPAALQAALASYERRRLHFL